MDEHIRVCHVVNAVDTTSVPADIATALMEYTNIDADILAWFQVEQFDGIDKMSVHCINAPDDTLGVNPRVIRETYDILGNYDIVQTHHPHSGTYAKFIAKLRRKKVVSTEQNSHVAFTRKGLVANAFTNVLADEVTCVSDAVRRSLHWWERTLLDDDNVSVIYNGVDLERIRRSKDMDWSVNDVAAVDPNAILIGNAAMFTEQKAHDTLVRAISRAREKANVELVLAGDGKKRDEIERLVRRVGIEDAVHFLGLIERKQVYRLMTEVDIYAMPSRWEGFSAAAIEALAVGTPCIFSKIDEFTEAHRDVALFHPVDDIPELADHIVELAESPEKRDRLSELSHAHAEQFSTECIAEDYRDLYVKLLS